MYGGEKTNYDNCNHVLLKVRELQLAFSDHKVIEIRKISKINSKYFSFGVIATDLNRLQRGVGRALVDAAEDLARNEGP